MWNQPLGDCSSKRVVEDDCLAGCGQPPQSWQGKSLEIIISTHALSPFGLPPGRPTGQTQLKARQQGWLFPGAQIRVEKSASGAANGKYPHIWRMEGNFSKQKQKEEEGRKQRGSRDP